MQAETTTLGFPSPSCGPRHCLADRMSAPPSLGQGARPGGGKTKPATRSSHGAPSPASCPERSASLRFGPTANGRSSI